MEKDIKKRLEEMDKEGVCIYCGGEVFCDGEQPYELWKPANRIKQTLVKGVVHRDCFMKAFDKFNAQMNYKGNLENYKILKEICFRNGV